MRGEWKEDWVQALLIMWEQGGIGRVSCLGCGVVGDVGGSG